MSSLVVRGQVMHHRLGETPHSFVYPVGLCVFEVDELPQLATAIPFFGYNRANLLAIHDRDYLGVATGSLRQKVEGFLATHQSSAVANSIWLITSPRYLNYVFNPVSFFYCFDTEGSVSAILAEVNNTFGERHIYLLDKRNEVQRDRACKYESQKEFHVSPFLDTHGEYHFSFSPIADRIDIKIDLAKQGQLVFKSRLWGTCLPLDAQSLRRMIIMKPISSMATFPRICKQAAVLYYRKGLAVHSKPVPSSANTRVVREPNWLEKVGSRVFFRFLDEMTTSRFSIKLPDDSVRLLGKAKDGKVVDMHIREWEFFRRVCFGGDIAFGDTYVERIWETNDLLGLLRAFVDAMEQHNDRDLLTTKAARIGYAALGRLRRNSKRNSKHNISAHYDLGNELFSRFLDESMSYSSALYLSPTDTLKEAQQNKIRAIIEKSQVRPEHHVLEIGSGWGSLAIALATQTGCRVTTITLSEQQKSLAESKIAEAGLSDRVKVRLQDYRDVTGTYDRIVSVEMLEAVGYEYYGDFFSALERLAKPDALVVLQVITIPDQRFEDYRKNCDWIQRCIFPGGLLPSLEALACSMRKHSSFFVEQLDNIGPHYARTLRDWRAAFDAAKADLSTLGYDQRFQRMWDYYLCYCEAGFAARIINALQLVLTKPSNNSLNHSLPFIVSGKL